MARPAVGLRVVLASCIAILPALASTRAADQELSAAWHDADVVVDGAIADWPRLQRIGTGPAVAVQNDGDALCLVVASNDVTVREQLATGLVVWLDSTARNRQTFGLRLEGLAPRPLEGATPDAGAGNLSDRVRNVLEEFDLLGPARLQRRLVDSAGDVGITLASGVEDGTVVYELRLPLAKSDATPYAIGVKPGATISLGLETPADPPPPRSANRLDAPMDTRPRLGDPWGYGGYFSQPPPPPGGWAREPKPVEFKPMKLTWARVRLAAAPTRQ